MHAKESRLFLSHIFRLCIIFANYTFLGPVKMTIEAMRGRTFSGEVLTCAGRVNHLIIQSANVYAYVLFFTGHVQSAGLWYACSWFVDSIQYYPEILVSIGRLCESIHLKRISTTITRIQYWFDEKGVRSFFFKHEHHIKT